MPNHLEPCPFCRRHVRVSEPECPFCGETLPESFQATPPPRIPKRRLGRAATFVFRASIAGAAATGAAATACGAGSHRGDDIGDIGDDGDDGALYGGSPPEDGGTPGEDAGVDAGEDSGVAAEYGVAPLYGVTPADGGPDDGGGGGADYGTAPPKPEPPAE